MYIRTASLLDPDLGTSAALLKLSEPLVSFVATRMVTLESPQTAK